MKAFLFDVTLSIAMRTSFIQTLSRFATVSATVFKFSLIRFEYHTFETEIFLLIESFSIID